MGRRGRKQLTAGNGVFFVTTTFIDFKPLHLDDSYYRLTIDSLNFLQRRGEFALIAYCLMPSHLHLVLQILRAKTISEVMRDFKKYTSFRFRKKIENDGHHRMLESLRLPSGSRQVFKVWTDRFDDLVVTNEETLRAKIEYVHQNPVRAGLVERAEDWPYSSAAHYLQNGDSLVEVRWVSMASGGNT